MTKELSHYKTLPKFMVRRPFLPFNYVPNILEGGDFYDSIEKIISDQVIREAILVASPDLYNDLHILKKENRHKYKPKKVKQVSTSVLKYVSRMSTRATPFGLFSGVFIGEETNEITESFTASNCILKRARPDMEWIYGIVNQLEHEKGILRQLKVIWNPVTQVVGNRMELRFSAYCGQGNTNKESDKDTISIRNTEAVQYIQSIAQERILYADLVYKFINHYKNELDDNQLENFVFDLFTKEFLVSELRPDLTVSSPFLSLIDKLNKLKNIHSILYPLKEVWSLITEYNNSRMGEGIEKYTNILNKMSSIYFSKNILQVDFSYKEDTFRLPNYTTRQIGEVAHILWRLTTKDIGFEHLREYYMDFVDKYGTSTDVPLLELTNIETGLGFPKSYSDSESIKQSSKDKVLKIQKREQLLWRLLVNSIRNKTYEINLNMDLIEKLANQDKKEEYGTNSFELFGEIICGKGKKNPTVILNPNIGSYQTGLSFGRFKDLFSEKELNFIDESVNRVQESNKNIIVAEGTSIPVFGKTANVMVGENIYEYEVVIGSMGNPEKKQIPVSDIFVSANENHLILKSKTLKKDIKIVSSNMLNFSATSNLFRFLKEISLEDKSSWEPFDWGSLNNSPILPRVSYGDIIISPKLWNINIEDFKDSEIKSPEIWKIAFEKWKETMELPQYVQLEASDNHILLDLKNDYFLDELRKILKNQGNVRLREIVGEVEDRLISGEYPYSIECVFEIERENFTISNGKDITQINSLSESEIINLPLDNWIFMKIYLGKNLHSEFISNQLIELIHYLKKKDLISKWFYIIYEDPTDHIRLRFYNENSKTNKLLLDYLIQWNRMIVRNNGVKRICFDTYDPEISRYGGPTMIDIAEGLFQKDSELSLNLVKMNRYKLTSLPDYILGVLSILDLLSYLKKDEKEQMNFIALLGQKTEYKKEYREWKKFLFDYKLKNIKEQEKLASLFKIRNNELVIFSKNLNINKKTLWNTEDNIIASLIHMNCNRLFGTDREMEKKVLSISSHMLRDWYHYQHHVLKK